VANQEQQPGTSGAPAETTPAPLTSKGAARRRMAGAAGVIMTMASQPGMAATAVCTSPSGWLSGGLSRAPASACNGVSPGYWNNPKKSWTSTGVSRDTPFSDIFDCGGCESTYGMKTMGAMMSPQSFDTENIGRHLAATYLNVVSGRISFLTAHDVQKIWYDYRHGGYKPFNANHIWTTREIVDYLKKTMS
jgi:hypothetical protein